MVVDLHLVVGFAELRQDAAHERVHQVTRQPSESDLDEPVHESRLNVLAELPEQFLQFCAYHAVVDEPDLGERAEGLHVTNGGVADVRERVTPCAGFGLGREEHATPEVVAVFGLVVAHLHL